MTIQIPNHEKLLERIMRKLTKYAAQAARLGLDALEVTTKNVEKTETDEDGIVIIRHYIDLTIEGEIPRINGYEVVGMVESRENSGNIIRGDVPNDIKQESLYCDHCKTARPKKKIFILKGEEGDYIRVGKSCINDFLGIEIDEQMEYWSMLDPEWIQNIEKDFNPRTTYSYNIVELLALSIAQIRKDGRYYAGGGTRSSIFDHYNRHVEYRINTTDNDWETAHKVIEWYKNQVTSNEYIENIQTLMEGDTIDGRDIGLMVSAPVAYLKEMELNKIENQKMKGSNHVGTVGEKINMELTYVDFKVYEGTYGTGYFHKFEDADGNLLIWSTNKELENIERGDKVNIAGTIKKHDDYRGLNQTYITRCKIS